MLLVVAVSDRTLLTDRRVKLPTSPAAGLPEVWLLNLQQDRLEVSREPEGDRYGASRIYRHTERIAPLAFPGLEVAVADLLPPRRRRTRAGAGGGTEPGSPSRGSAFLVR